jgi:hypothetical protein
MHGCDDYRKFAYALLARDITRNPDHEDDVE